MPVLGHAFVGLAIGVSTRPSAVGHSEPGGIGVGSGLWLPAVVTLAYLPDIVAQLGLIAGWSDGHLLGHSVMFAVVVSPAIAAMLTRLAKVSFPRAFVTVLVSLLVHDVLDLVQATDRAPWWPLSDRPVGFDLGLIPTDLRREAAVFGGLLLAFVALRHAVHRWTGQSTVDPPIAGRGPARLVWLGRAFIVAVVLVALVTHSLRDARDAQLETGRALVEQSAYQAGLEALARAERWPSTTKPGRIDYLRAEAYAGMGDRQRAETYYLRAYRADRTYFWTVADLALFYASSGEPVAERRRAAEPYLNRLRDDFVRDPALPEVLTQVERKLAPRGTPPHETQLGK
jgi:LexA-binding, inner membrane-associated putative hydrolase